MNNFCEENLLRLLLREKIGALIVERIRCIFMEIGTIFVVENIGSISSLRKCFWWILMFKSSVEAILLLL
jgi:hypothetical protein